MMVVLKAMGQFKHNKDEYTKFIKRVKIQRVKGGFTLSSLLGYRNDNPNFILKTKKACRKIIKNLLKHRYVDD